MNAETKAVVERIKKVGSEKWTTIHIEDALTVCTALEQAEKDNQKVVETLETVNKWVFEAKPLLERGGNMERERDQLAAALEKAKQLASFLLERNKEGYLGFCGMDAIYIKRINEVFALHSTSLAHHDAQVLREAAKKINKQIPIHGVLAAGLLSKMADEKEKAV